VPADKKWFRNLAVMEQIVRALRPHREEWTETLRAMGKRALKEIEALRAEARRKGLPPPRARGDD
jgi:hypothetical protein